MTPDACALMRRCTALTRGLDNPLATPPPAPASANEGTWVGIDRLLGGGRASATVDLGGPSITAGLDGQALRDNRTNKRSVDGVATDTLLLDQTRAGRRGAVFAQLAWPVGSRVSLRGGARRDDQSFLGGRPLPQRWRRQRYANDVRHERQRRHRHSRESPRHHAGSMSPRYSRRRRRPNSPIGPMAPAASIPTSIRSAA